MFYLGFPQYENEEFWAYIDRLKQFLDSLDDHGFSEQEMRLTIEKGINCQVRSLLDSMCDGDLSSKSDDEAYDLFDWLNRESRKPNFSLLLSIEESTLENVGGSVVTYNECYDEIGICEEIEDILEGRLEIEVGKPFEQVEVNTPSFEDESCTRFEDISITSSTPLTTPTNDEDAIFEDYKSESNEESIIFDELEVKWDDEYLCEEVFLEKLDVEIDLIEEPILEKFDVFLLDDDESLGPIDFIDLISLDPLLEIVFDEEESVSTDCEGDFVVHLLGDPIFERFEAPFCGEDEFPIPTYNLDLISYAHLLEVVTFDVEYDAPILDKACMIELLETPLPFICDDDCDAFPSYFEKFVFDMDGLHSEVKGKDTSEVSFVVDCSLLVAFDHSPPMKEEVFYEVEFENVEENDHNLHNWRELKDFSFIDDGMAMSGLAHRLWDPG